MQVVEASGARIPAIGLGTWELRGRACARIVEQALRLGYRHIDTAQMYDNEREVGEGLRASGAPRYEVFLTTKIWPTHFAPNDLIRSLKESLVKLRLAEVDLVLLHWPSPRVPLSETLDGLAHARQSGLAKNIGISNFNVALTEEAVALSKEPLVCNQVEYHPYLDQAKVLEACRRLGLATVAYSPVRKRAGQGRPHAGAHRPTSSQDPGSGLSPLARSTRRRRDPAHLKTRTATGECRRVRLRAARGGDGDDFRHGQQRGADGECRRRGLGLTSPPHILPHPEEAARLRAAVSKDDC